MARLLIVDDESEILKALRRELHGSDWKVESFDSPAKALEAVAAQDFDVVMSDFRMPEMTGVEFLTEVRALKPSATRIILSGYTDADAVLDSVNHAGIFKYLVKPWKTEELLEALEAAREFAKQLARGHGDLNEDSETNRKRLRQELLQRLEKEEPGLTQVDFSPNNTIWLQDEP